MPILPLFCMTALVAAPTVGPGFELQASGTTARLRGVSAVDPRVAWASGTNGTVLRTVDGGRTWVPRPVPGTEKLDFRDIEAFSAEEATVLSIGPGEASRIYRTKDGGATWTLQFTNPEPKAFYNALAFWTPKRGLAMSDPVEGRFRLLATEDGGASWRVLKTNLPEALPEEGAFAASGTCLVVGPARRALFVTGGARRGRAFASADGGRTWTVAATEQEAETASAGLFGALLGEKGWGATVGGDYRRPEAPSRIQLTEDGGRTWRTASRLPGLRSALAALPNGTLVAVGPEGYDLSRDGGRSWTALGTPGFHATSSAGTTVWAVGEQGRIGKLVLEP